MSALQGTGIMAYRGPGFGDAVDVPLTIQYKKCGNHRARSRCHGASR
jgi:hypothetical protein